MAANQLPPSRFAPENVHEPYDLGSAVSHHSTGSHRAAVMSDAHLEEDLMGVSIGVMKLPATASGVDDPWAMVREAERLGFESLWAGEHDVIPGQTGSSNAYYAAGADHVQLLGTPRAQNTTGSERAGIDWLRRVAERVL
jgi:hypothetical protein